MVDTIELRRLPDSRFYFFTFRASNGDAIVESRRYETKRGALHAIEVLRRHAHDALLDDRTGDDAPENR